MKKHKFKISKLKINYDEKGVSIKSKIKTARCKRCGYIIVGDTKRVVTKYGNWTDDCDLMLIAIVNEET